MPLYRESPYLRATGDRRWPSNRRKVERNILEFDGLATDAIAAPHAGSLALAFLRQGDKATVSYLSIASHGAAGELVKAETTAIKATPDILAVIKEDEDSDEPDVKAVKADTDAPVASFETGSDIEAHDEGSTGVEDEGGGSWVFKKVKKFGGGYTYAYKDDGGDYEDVAPV